MISDTVFNAATDIDEYLQEFPQTYPKWKSGKLNPDYQQIVQVKKDMLRLVETLDSLPLDVLLKIR